MRPEASKRTNPARITTLIYSRHRFWRFCRVLAPYKAACYNSLNCVLELFIFRKVNLYKSNNSIALGRARGFWAFCVLREALKKSHAE